MRKKVLSLVLALTLCIGLAIPAVALEVDTNVGQSSGVGEDDVIAIENGVCIIQVNAWGHVEITNATSIGEIDGQVTIYTSSPTKVQVFGEVWGDALGSHVWKLALTPSGDIDWNGEMTNVAATEGVRNDTKYADEVVYDNGATFTLETGTYNMSAAMNNGILIVVGGASTTTPAPETPSSWAVESVNAAIAAGLVPDALQSKYTQATTRAEFCALAVALFETVTELKIEDYPKGIFTDTNDANVEIMASLGVVNGIGDGKFGPENKLTREQAATMLSRLADAMGKSLTEQAPTFNDNASISSWAVDAVGQMQATGIMTGVGDNTFSPATDYTREQSIITIMRLFDIVK